MKGIAPLQGEIIAKQEKYTENFQKIFFSRTSRPNSNKPGTHYPCVKGINFVQIKGQILLKGEIIMKMSKWGGVG